MLSLFGEFHEIFWGFIWPRKRRKKPLIWSRLWNFLNFFRVTNRWLRGLYIFFIFFGSGSVLGCNNKSMKGFLESKNGRGGILNRRDVSFPPLSPVSPISPLSSSSSFLSFPYSFICSIVGNLWGVGLVAGLSLFASKTLVFALSTLGIGGFALDKVNHFFYSLASDDVPWIFLLLLFLMHR